MTENSDATAREALTAARGWMKSAKGAILDSRAETRAEAMVDIDDADDFIDRAMAELDRALAAQPGSARVEDHDHYECWCRMSTFTIQSDYLIRPPNGQAALDPTTTPGERCAECGMSPTQWLHVPEHEGRDVLMLDGNVRTGHLFQVWGMDVVVDPEASPDTITLRQPQDLASLRLDGITDAEWADLSESCPEGEHEWQAGEWTAGKVQNRCVRCEVIRDLPAPTTPPAPVERAEVDRRQCRHCGRWVEQRHGDAWSDSEGWYRCMKGVNHEPTLALPTATTAARDGGEGP